MVVGRPALSTVSTASPCSSRSAPGSAAKASVIRSAMRSRPPRLRDPLLTAAHASTSSSIGSAAARSTAACSTDDNSPMRGFLARAPAERHTGTAKSAHEDETLPQRVDHLGFDRGKLVAEQPDRELRTQVRFGIAKIVSSIFLMDCATARERLANSDRRMELVPLLADVELLQHRIQ